ncbi:MAG: hypothetical protein SPF22_07925 [Candidatus Onthovivens sp.]|nr:hypothetical protein [Candidatus Onthovivens sp.]
MIYVFNETDSTQWYIGEKNEYFLHLGVGEGNFGIGLLQKGVSEEMFETNSLLENSSPKKVVKVLSWLGFNVYYNNKSGLPFLRAVESGDYAQDVYLLTYKIPEGMKIITEKTGKIAVQYVKYDSEAGLIHIIATARPSNNPFYFLTFADEEYKNFVTKHLVQNKKTNTIDVFIQNYTREEVEESKFKSSIVNKEMKPIVVKPAKVLQPYSIIVYPFAKTEVKDILTNRYKKSDEFCKFIDSSKKYKDIIAELAKYHQDKFNAVSIYIDKPFDKVTDDDMYRASKIAKDYRRVNFVCSDGKIKSK